MRILVAMSGGIDSSVVAHLLKRQGHDIVGVMMKLWTDPLAPEVKRAIPTKCCSIEHIERARSVCSDLEIPFYVLNLEKQFKKEVVDPFLRDYADGKTPNPCILCNRSIKFGALLQKMEELQCEKLATGHYARIATEESSDGNTKTVLLEATDPMKDQSYYLYALSQEQLRDVLFPLGNMHKEDVFALAREFSVPVNEHYRESQDLCFFPEKNPKAFLKRYLTLTPGPIKTRDGNVVGKHEGLPLYTEGQRKGLGIGGLKIPLHIVEKEQISNTIYVAPNRAEVKLDISATMLHWIAHTPPEDTEVSCEARLHSLGERHHGALHHHGNHATFHCEEGITDAAPGQSIVFYRGQEVFGGGVITA